MKITVHRGTHQIGGCATEIRTENTRILIDFGAQLPDSTGYVPAEYLKIDGLNIGEPSFDAVFLTHYHSDHLGLTSRIPDSIPVYLGRDAIEIYKLLIKTINGDINNVLRMRPLDNFHPVDIGDIRVTSIPADHSAFGAMMFLIESNGKRVLHTGDFRLHGFRAKITIPILRKCARENPIDVLIIEGTQLSGSSHVGISEFELQSQIRDVIAKNKYVFVLCSSTNIDRLASFHNVTPRGRYFVCDTYQKHIFDIVAAGTKSQYYKFAKALFYGENLDEKLRERGFVMAVRANSQFTKIVQKFPDSILIYSMWNGYLDGRAPYLSEFVRPFQTEKRIKYLHTSGHATVGGLKAVCEAVAPSLVIPIHSERPEQFTNLGLTCPVKILQDGEHLCIGQREKERRLSRMSRALTDTLFTSLQSGVLNPFLLAVQRDNTLDLEFRGNSIDIYYRGGRLYHIQETSSTTPSSYSVETKYSKQLPHNPSLSAALEMIPNYKQQMDEHIHNDPALEREIEQWMVRINNKKIGKYSSDYYIADIEYTDSTSLNARFDMVAVKWPSTIAGRRANPLSLALIELKCGDEALTDASGILKHLDDMESFIASPAWPVFVQDIQKIFQQKCKLGLIDGVKEHRIDGITIPDATPEKIFVFAEHDPDKTKLRKELTKIATDNKSHPGLCFATASAMGYRLSKDYILKLDDFLKYLKK